MEEQQCRKSMSCSTVHGHPVAKTLFRRVPASAFGKHMHHFSDLSKALFMNWPAMLGPHFLFLPLQLALDPDGKLLRNRFMHVAITRYSEAAFVFASSSVMRKVFLFAKVADRLMSHWMTVFSTGQTPCIHTGDQDVEALPWSYFFVHCELWIVRMPSQGQCH